MQSSNFIRKLWQSAAVNCHFFHISHGAKEDCFLSKELSLEFSIKTLVNFRLFA